MLAAGLGGIFLARDCTGRALLDLLGHPTVALLLGVLVSFFTFGRGTGIPRDRILKLSEESLGPIALMLLVVGAGGGFSRVLIESGVGKAMAELAKAWHLAPIPMGFAAACLIRVATGSATVAITTAAGLAAPLADAVPGTNRELLLLAMGAGSLILSHVNDGGFWFVKECLGLTVTETLKTWTVLETVLSLAAFGMVLLLSRFV
jgi:GntP family gluconate:H+ symporter